MNKQFYLFTIGLFCINTLLAQSNQGARLTAMGNNGAAVKDAWGVAANPAAITDISLPSLQLNHQQHFLTKELRNQALAFVFPAGRQLFGLHLQRYGIPEYHTIKIGIVATKQLGAKLAIGVRANYHQLKISNYGAINAISLDVGAIYQASPELCFGFYINNPSAASYRLKTMYLNIPKAAYIGITYQTSAKLLLAGTVSGDIIATGIDYKVVDAFTLRGGISINPFTHYIGIGFNKTKYMIDFTVSKNPILGYSPQLTIGYVF